ncbi:MAG: pentapeptide repeat-containing protein [Limisphaerales bacterium]
MAAEKHLTILYQGVEAWNKWRRENAEASPNLSMVNLTGGKLSGADLTGANLTGAKLSWADLTGAKLSGADLTDANLKGADLSSADLTGADLTNAFFGGTVFGNADLSEVRGLEAAQHFGPSTIGIDTFFLSKGKIAESFLRGAGVPDIFLQYAASLSRRKSIKVASYWALLPSLVLYNRCHRGC